MGTTINRRLLTFAAITLGLQNAATASTITAYQDSATFRASAQNLQTIDFEGLLAPRQAFEVFPSLIQDGIIFQGVNMHGYSDVAVLDSASNVDQTHAYPPGKYLDDRAARLGLAISFPTGISAVSFEVFVTDPSPTMVTIAVSGEQPPSSFLSVPMFASPQRTFFGITSDSSISGIDLYGSRLFANVAVANVSFGQAGAVATVPEPANFGIFGVVFVGMTVIWPLRRLRNNGARLFRGVSS